jgi:V/A-type H+-transporting ATPase subunit K
MLGAAAAALFSGIGSSIGVGLAAQAAAGVISEEPDRFGKTMLLQLLPATQALYGFVVGFMVLMRTVMTAGVTVTDTQGWMLFAVCLPVGIVGMFSAIYQGKVCAAGINMVGKRPELSGRGMTMGIFVEMFALFALIISFIGVMTIQLG